MTRCLHLSFCLAAAAVGLWSLCANLLAQTKDVSPDHAAKMAKGLDLFKKHVKPVLMEKCLRCHGGKAVESEFDLSDRDSLIKGGIKGPSLVPGKSKESLLIKLINHVVEPHMPKGRDKLPAETIAHISRWIDF